MNNEKIIEHEGTIREISDGKLKVSFISQSACASCRLKGLCSAADMVDKEVEVEQGGRQYHIGEKVNIVLAQPLGLKAMAYGYIFPFFLVLITLFAVYGFTGDEILSGVTALAILIPYYFCLYLFRYRIRKEFKFMVRKFV